MVAAEVLRSSSHRPVERVLIVDDSRDNRLTLGVLLRSEGYLVHLAKNGAEGLRLAAAHQPDVALIDLVMPDRSGFHVAYELHRRYRNECPVLIAITAHDTTEIEQQAKTSGFHHFVGKPYDPQALLRLLQSLDKKT